MPFIINSYNFAAETPSFSYVLDDYPTNVAAGYSVRKLKSSYTGYCMKIRRSSDNTLQDIGFVDNYLDVQAIADFCGAGNGQVHTWYDQVGLNGVYKDMLNTDSTSVRQPYIYSAGTLQTFGDEGKAGLRFIGGSTNVSWMGYDIGAIVTGTTSTRIIYNFYPIDDDYVLFVRNTSINCYLIRPKSGGTSTSINALVGTPSYYRNNDSVFTGTTQDQLYNYLGGQDKSVLSILNADFTTMSAGGDRQNLITSKSGGISFAGYINEMLMYNASGETLSDIVTNINDYYGIF